MGQEATASAGPSQRSWSNWFGNESCSPKRFEQPRTEAEVQELVAWASQRGLTVRVAGSGHSVTPVVVTDGVLLDLSQLEGGVRADPQSMTAKIAPGLRLEQLNGPLWEQGFALRNIGEIARATLAGAVSTGVHGTGLDLQCTSGAVRGMRLVTATGDVVEVSGSTPELLRASQISIGMLGVITELDIAVEHAYELHERALFLDVEETLATWDEMLHAYRHYSFYYLPNPAAANLFAKQIPAVPNKGGEVCWILLRNVAGTTQVGVTLGPDGRRDRWDRILTFDFEDDFREIEFAIPLDQAKDTFRAVRRLLGERYPQVASPIDVRFTAPDDALLSPYQGAAKAVFSVSVPTTDNWRPLLRDAEELFTRNGGLPHWGKLHSLTPARLRAGIPTAERFTEIRRELDPRGTFLTPPLKPLFN